MPPTMNKTKLGNALKTIFMLTVLAANAVADDAAIKQQLVGRWEYKGDIMVLEVMGKRLTVGKSGMCKMENSC